MRERGIDALILTSPEDLYYLLGLDHLGYFAVTALVLPLDGDPCVVARPTMRSPSPHNARGCGSSTSGDSEEPAPALWVRCGRWASPPPGPLREEPDVPPAAVETAAAELPQAAWPDGSGIVEDPRMVKSPAELAYTRPCAAALSDVAARACIEAAGVGVNERDVVAEVYRALTSAGSEYVAFPLIARSTATLQHGHGTWSNYALRRGDALFFDLSGRHPSLPRSAGPPALDRRGPSLGGARRASHGRGDGRDPVAAAPRPC